MEVPLHDQDREPLSSGNVGHPSCFGMRLANVLQNEVAWATWPKSASKEGHFGMQSLISKRRGSGGILLSAHIDRTGKVGLQEQLYTIFRDLILSGRLSGGARLPSTRVVALETGISRNTVLTVFEQLQCEGYLSSKVGSGTRVSLKLPNTFFHAEPAIGVDLDIAETISQPISARGRLVETMAGVNAELTPAFSPGMPALDQFPFQVWSKLLTEEWRAQGTAPSYDAAGFLPLREQITEYVRTARGITCVAEQVIIVSGNREGTELASRVLLDPGEAAIVEEPGYPGIRFALAASGVRATPLRVCQDGIMLSDLSEQHRGARMLCTAPSHQYPLGCTTSLPQRLALLDWARREECWIVEDDYDSEFRYRERPLPSLQSLDRQARIIYVGTFSKTLLPSLRLGYLIVPKGLIRPFLAMKLATSGPTAVVSQRAVSRFIETGMFYRHVRSMRTLYAQRRSALMGLIEQRLPELVIPRQESAGLFLTTLLRDDVARSTTDVEIAAAVRKAGLHIEPLSPLYVTEPKLFGLIFGFGGLAEHLMQEPLDRIGRIIRNCVTVASHSS